MTIKRKSLLWPTLLIALLFLTALTFAAYGKLRSEKTTGSKVRSQSASDQAKVNRGAYVRPSALSPKLVWHLKAMEIRVRPSPELGFRYDEKAS